jgi:hypothetical protein
LQMFSRATPNTAHHRTRRYGISTKSLRGTPSLSLHLRYACAPFASSDAGTVDDDAMNAGDFITV